MQCYLIFSMPFAVSIHRAREEAKTEIDDCEQRHHQLNSNKYYERVVEITESILQPLFNVSFGGTPRFSLKKLTLCFSD